MYSFIIQLLKVLFTCYIMTLDPLQKGPYIILMIVTAEHQKPKVFFILVVNHT